MSENDVKKNEVSKEPIGEIHVPAWKNIFGWLISEDVGDIRKDVVYPALRDLLYNIVTIFIYGSPRQKPNSQIDYANNPSRRDFRQQTNYNYNAKPKQPRVSDYKYVRIDNIEKARRAVTDIQDWANRYGKLSVARYWDILEITRENNPMEQHWGWYPDMLTNLGWRRDMEGYYVLVIPEPVYFE